MRVRTESVSFVEFFTHPEQDIFGDEIGARTRVLLDPYCIDSIRFPNFHGSIAIVEAECRYVVTLEDAERLRDAARDADPKLLNEADLQDALEMAERRHTRLLAEVARRSP